MYRRDADQQSDTMVLLWDAVASGRTSPAQGEHAEVHGLISNFLALDDTPMPDPAFLHRLEAQVIDAGAEQQSPAGFQLSPPHKLHALLPASLRRVFQPESPSRRRLASYGRWAAAQAAMAVLLVIALGGIGVIYLTGTSDDPVMTIPSTGGGGFIPAPPAEESEPLPSTGGERGALSEPGTVQAETLASFLADPAGFPIGEPGNWNQVHFELGYVEPGAAYDMGLREITCCRPGLAAIHVRQGSGSVELSGQANVVRSGHDPASPEVHEASTPIALTTGDTVWYDIEAHPVVTNSGSDRLMLLSLAAVERSNFGTVEDGSMPPGYVAICPAMSTGYTLLQPGSIETSIERIELQPEDAFHFSSSGNRYAMAIVENSFIHYYKDTGNGPPPPSLIHAHGPGQGISFHEFSTGDYVIENPRDEPVVVYLMTMSNAPDAESDDSSSALATPVAGETKTASEQLLSTIIDPASVGAESQSAWQTAALATVVFSPGMQFTPDESSWGDALDAFVVLEGSVSVESATPSQIVRAGADQPEPLGAGIAADLAPGDNWIAGIGTSFTMTNNGSTEATLMLFHHGVDQSLFGFGAGTIGVYPPGFRPILHAEDPDPLTFDGPVSLSLERVTVNNGEAFHLDVVDGEMLLLGNADRRGFQATRDGSSTPLTLLGGAALNLYTPGDYTISHLYGDAPLTLYVARMSDAPAVASDAAATPAAESASPVAQQAVTEELVQFLADPASSPIGNPEEWDEVVAEIGLLEPGASFDASLRNLTCCRFGLGALHIIDGTMSVELSGPSSVIRAGQDPATPELYEPSTDIALGPGDTIWYGIEAHPFVTNTGSTELNLLNFSVHDFSGDASVEGRLDTYQRPGFSMNSNIYTSDELPLQPGIASTSIQRIDLDPEASSTLTVSENQRLIALIAQGTIQFHKDTGDRPVPPSLINSRGVGLGTAFHNFTPGDYTIENKKDDPATLYVLTITTVPD